MPLSPDLQATVDEMTRLAVAMGCDSLAAAISAEARPLIPEEQRTSVHTEAELNKFVTADPELLALKDTVRKLSKVSDTVLITGETGTGKQLIASALHGDRKGRFVTVNCTSLPDQLLESELFGHIKGAFTGADRTRHGLFVAANAGTLFLDEIGYMRPNMQEKLLVALQEKRVRPVGSDEDHPVNCRVICATRMDIKEKLTIDLYYRLTTFILRIKPLRERPREDFVSLIKTADNEKKLTQDQLDSLLSMLVGARLDGNVREIQQRVRQTIVLGKVQ